MIPWSGSLLLQCGIAAYANVVAWYVPVALRPAIKRKILPLVMGNSEEVRNKIVEVASISADFAANTAAAFALAVSLAVEIGKTSDEEHFGSLPIVASFLVIVPVLLFVFKTKWLDQSEARYSRRLGRGLRLAVLISSILLVMLSFRSHLAGEHGAVDPSSSSRLVPAKAPAPERPPALPARPLDTRAALPAAQSPSIRPSTARPRHAPARIAKPRRNPM